MGLKLRDLIKSIRSCKTQQEERQVVQKECASIRDGFRKEDADNRGRNIAKLLYIHMLGYPAHFGQVECLKLVTSNKFSDKRIGYLGAMMLLDELKDIHMLITNSMQNDLGHQLQYVSGLALCTLGTIVSVDMARDLAGDVEKLLKSSNSYVRKKAVLCAVRILRRVPDLMDNFVPATRSLLGDRNHGVLITGVTLITEMCSISPENLGHFRRLVPTLVRVLKNLIMSATSHEHDVSGVTDPFLQCKIIRLLRILCKGDAEASESVNDILAQVATNTESTKTVGNAILYETVMCIMEIHAESGLRVLAINILGKFLANSDRNIRYVGLSTLLSTVASPDNADAMQRHRSTIIDCLQEPDVTIRKRALQLIFALINSGNIENLVRELLEFMSIADTQFKKYIVTEIFAVAERYSPSPRWHVDTVLATLEQGEEHVPLEMFSDYIQLLAAAEHAALQPYIVQRCFKLLKAKSHFAATTMVCAWCIGEFGDLLCGQSALEPAEAPVAVAEALDVLQKVMDATTSNEMMKGITLTATMKLSSRFTGVEGRIRTMVGQHADSAVLEMQQRSVEYTTIFNAYDSKRPQLLERMPVMERKAPVSDGGGAAAATTAAPVAPIAAAPAAASGETDLLGDLLGGSSPAATAPAAAQPPASSGGLSDLLGLDLSAPTLAAPPPTAGGGLMDLLGGGAPAPAIGGGGGLMDLLGGPLASTPMAPATAATPAAGGGTMDLLGDLLGGAPAAVPAPAVQAPAAGIPPMVVWDKGGLNVKFDFAKNPAMPNVLQILLTATNSTPAPMGNFLFQIAVPTTLQLKLDAQTSSVIPAMGGGSVTQQILVNNPQKIPIRMRIKISYLGGSGQVEELGEVGNFPAGAV